MFNKNLPWLENSDGPELDKKYCIDYVATLIQAWHLNDDPELLWLDSKEDWDYERDQDTYEKSLAVTYLEMVYNKSSNYSSQEQLMYLAWVFSRL